MALPSRLAVRSILGSSSWVSWTAVNATFATLAETGMRKGDVLRPKQGGTFEKGRLTFASALAGCGLRRQRGGRLEERRCATTALPTGGRRVPHAT